MLILCDNKQKYRIWTTIYIVKKILKFFRGINKTIIIVSIILILPALFFVYQDFSYKNRIISEKQNEKKKNQKAFDNCVYRAEYTYLNEERSQCWIYNHDATSCDLSYFETYKIGDTPTAKFKKNILACEDKYSPADRLYSFTSPEYKSLLDHPLGNFTEREAVRKVIGPEKTKEIVKFPIEEGYHIDYDVEAPSEDKPYWIVHLYKVSNNKDILTVKYWKIDAFTGNVSEEIEPVK